MSWIHIACNNLDKKTDKLLQSSSIKWFYISFPIQLVKLKVLRQKKIKLVMKNIIKSLYFDINEINDKLNESQSIFKNNILPYASDTSSLQYHLAELRD